MEHTNEADLGNAPYAFFQQDDGYGGHPLTYPPGPQMAYQVVNPPAPDVMGMRQLNLSLGHPGPNFSYPGSPTRLAQNTHLPPSPSPVDTTSVYDHPISPPVSGSDTSTTDGSTYHTPHGHYSRESSSPPSIRRNHGQHRFNPTSGHRRRRSSTNDEGDFSDEESGPRGPMVAGQALAEHLSNSRKEATRKQRIEAEQRRRDELREGYARLKEVLPVTNQKSSKVSLLERATNYIANIDEQNNVLNAKVASLDSQIASLRRANERLALMVAQHTGHVPTEEELGIIQTYEERTPIDSRPLSPPPDIQPQVSTPQAMHHQHPEHHQPQLHQPHPQQAQQMYQHRNESTASASGSEYSLN